MVCKYARKPILALRICVMSELMARWIPACVFRNACPDGRRVGKGLDRVPQYPSYDSTPLSSFAIWPSSWWSSSFVDQGLPVGQRLLTQRCKLKRVPVIAKVVDSLEGSEQKVLSRGTPRAF